MIRDALEYLASWEFFVSLPLSSLLFVSTAISHTEEQVLSSMLSVLEILLTVLSITLSLFITATSREFVKYIEDKSKAYSTVINLHIFGITLYIVTIICGVFFMSNKEVLNSTAFLMCCFLFVYSVMYTLEMLRHFKAYVRYKLHFSFSESQE